VTDVKPVSKRNFPPGDRPARCNTEAHRSPATSNRVVAVDDERAPVEEIDLRFLRHQSPEIHIMRS